jgi:ribosomal protein S18 acetylase RimI-like enzyme
MQQAKPNLIAKQKVSRFQEQKKRNTRNKKNVGAMANPQIALQYRMRTVEDDPYILQLTRQELGETHARAFGEPFPEQDFLRYIQSGAPTYLIENKGNKVGYYSYLVGPDQKMHVSALVIDPKRQSSGIGKAVMDQLESVAKSAGVKTMEVFVQESNTRSIEFTKSLGFNEVFRFPPHTICFQKQI